MSDSNGSQINISDGLPFKFTNQFKEPLDINPNSKIEVVSADLKVDDVHDVSLQNDNNAFTYCLGVNGATVGSQRFLQKQARIPDGKYSNNQLANKITEQVGKTNLLDGFNIRTSYNSSTAFKINIDLEYNRATEEIDNNTYGLINSKMGFNESTTQQDTGIGTSAEQITIENQNDLSNANVLTKNSTLSVLTSTTSSNSEKPSSLISNVIVPTIHGINNAGGTTSVVMKPIKHLVFPTAYETPTAGKTFTSVIGPTTTNNITIEAEGGGHNLDFKFTAGATTYHAAFVKTKAQWDGYILPNSVTHGNLPWGHFLILNTSNQAVNNTLASNYCTLLLDTNDYKWKLWNVGTSGLTTFEFFATTNPAFVKTTATLTSLGNWGSGCLGISRGETCITGTNQVATGTNGRYTRTRVFNDSGDSDVGVDTSVFCDYVLQIQATEDGTDSYARMNSSEQVDGKVAGDVDWLTLTKQGLVDDLKIKTLLPTITADDNIILVASVSSWLCVKFFIGHDTGGNQQFINLKKLGDSDANNVGDGIALPNRFNEASFPLMPVVAPQNGYVKDEQKTLTIGQYSTKNVSTHSIAKLNEYMNTNWSASETIPTRQPKVSVVNYCNNFTLEDRIVTIESGDFSNIANSTFTIPNGIVKQNEPIRLNSDFDLLIRMSNLNSSDDEYKLLVNKGYSIEPNRLNTLNRSLGMRKIIYNDSDGLPEDPPKLEFNSTDLPLANGSQNFIVNLGNMGKVVGANSATKSVNKAIAIIPASSLVNDSFLGTKRYSANYPLPVNLNAATNEKVNNFEIYITTDENKPAISLMHPTSLVCRITD
jgi:hypothetical protein